MNKKHTTRNTKALIGIDYGTSFIGTSLGIEGFVTALENIPSKNLEAAVLRITRIGIENNIKKFVVGIPLDAEGNETKESIEVRRFGNILKRLSKKPVVYWNEFGTSKEALGEAIELGISPKQRRSNDSLAAALILRSYYEENH